MERTTTDPAVVHDNDLLVPSGPGLYGWGPTLERVFTQLDGFLTDVGRTPETRLLRFPPVLDRDVFETSEFARSFPQLVGAVHALDGDGAPGPTGYVLTPAACYPVYPLYAGKLPDRGASVDVSSYCFRHEPSTEPGRLVAFRQREFVRIADSATVHTWFTGWQSRALAAMQSLGLQAQLATAADPFFGKGARLLANSQREQHLKFEVLAPMGDHPVAVASCNHHRDHFGRAFGIRSVTGDTAHTACVGFGVERVAFALVATHGPVLERWPASVREVLGI